VVRVVDSSFVTSAAHLEQSPDALASGEVAFLGRSNVGKSSLLNSLANRKGLAKSSSTPGKTQLINFFAITYMQEQTKYKTFFVDLPGFGYAKVAKALKHEWAKNLTDFIEKREAIRLFVHLIDARHPMMAIDNEVDNFLATIVRPHQRLLHVITKIDKLNQKELNALKLSYPGALMVSNSNKKGIDALNEVIFNHLFPQENLS